MEEQRVPELEEKQETFSNQAKAVAVLRRDGYGAGQGAFDLFVRFLLCCHIISSITSKQKPREVYKAWLQKSFWSHQQVKGETTTQAELEAQTLG